MELFGFFSLRADSAELNDPADLCQKILMQQETAYTVAANGIAIVQSSEFHAATQTLENFRAHAKGALSAAAWT